ncbi:MAG: thiopeptide-type bacteriocin biosynthesis protein [Bacteroidales bacterium]
MKRDFIPGSEWLYFKIYTGFKTADNILIHKILPMTNHLTVQKMIDKWFFIRYSDPNFHLRLRLKINDFAYYNEIFKLFSSSFDYTLESGLVTKIMCDTYSRELERYGDKLIDISETFFCIDSIYILQILESLINSVDPDKDRWCISLKLIDDILNSFEFSLQNKCDLLLELSKDYKKEFGFTNQTQIDQINNKYRTNRSTIDNCFDENSLVKDYEYFIKERFEKIKPLSQQIIKGYIGDRNNLISHIKSLIHMTMNRLFRSSNRTYELVIYDFLYRYYKSSIARNKNKSSKLIVE